jgi:DNA-binding transcriptional LysR family regulator
MVDFRYLKAFGAAAKHLNFTRAAQELRISVSALSRQIALLENGMGGELFIRSTRQVTLTPLGTRLLGFTEGFERDLSSLDSAPPLRIGCLQSVFEFFLVELMQRKPQAFSGPLDITIGTPQSLNEIALAGGLDLVLTNIKPSESSTLSGIRLFREDLTWIGEGAGVKRPILFSATEASYPAKALKSGNRIRVNSFNATVAMAQRRIGNALVPVPSRSRERKPSAHAHWIYAVTPQYQRMPPQLKKIVELLKQSV